MLSTVEDVRTATRSPSWYAMPAPLPLPETFDGCHADAAEFHTRAWPLLGNVLATGWPCMAFTVAVVSVPLRSPPALGSWPEATVPDICDIKPGCHVETLEFHITAWPLTGAVFATARFCMPVTVAAVNVPLTSPPAAGSWLEPAVPDIWLKV